MAAAAIARYNSAMVGETAISILRRLIDSDQGELPPAAAEAVLRFRLAGADQIRMAELASKSSQGTLTPEEGSEYDGFIAAADLLSLWKSKARLSLKRHTSAA
jgi:hypothetical protein